MNLPAYTIAIRTLGKSGDTFVTEIKSILAQTHAPVSINAYIPDGYSRPEFEGSEHITWISSPKGMVTQRSLDFDEITTDYILFLDDDLQLAPDTVEKMMSALVENQADCITANVFENHKGSLAWKLKAIADGTNPAMNTPWAFRIRKSGFYSYCNNPSEIMETQSGAGACCLIKKSAYKNMHFEDERWLEAIGYCFGDDQMFHYKLHSNGWKILTHFSTGIVHLDAKTSHEKDKSKQFRNKNFLRYLLWHRSIYLPAKTRMERLWVSACFWGMVARLSLFDIAMGFAARDFYRLANRIPGVLKGRRMSKTDSYRAIPPFDLYKNTDSRIR